MPNRWSPDQYERHRAERERPATDLLALVEPVPGGSVVDLGCGSGRITELLHRHVGAGRTLGVDSSPEMLEVARRDHAGDGIEFQDGDLRDVDGVADVVFSNAALQWLDDQADVVARLGSQLPPGGQIAIQVPANFGHPSHTVADTLGQELGLPPQRSEIGALAAADYAAILHRAGVREIDATLRVYGNEMARTDDVVDWVRGTLLTSYERLLGDRFDEFLVEYRTRLLAALDDPSGEEPYFYPFSRILVYGRKPA